MNQNHIEAVVAAPKPQKEQKTEPEPQAPVIQQQDPTKANDPEAEMSLEEAALFNRQKYIDYVKSQAILYVTKTKSLKLLFKFYFSGYIFVGVTTLAQACQFYLQSVYYTSDFMNQYSVYQMFINMMSIPVPLMLAKMYIQQYSELQRKKADKEDLQLLFNQYFVIKIIFGFLLAGIGAACSFIIQQPKYSNYNYNLLAMSIMKPLIMTFVGSQATIMVYENRRLLGYTLYLIPELFGLGFETFIYSFFFKSKEDQKKAQHVMDMAFAPFTGLLIVFPCVIAWIIVWQAGKTCMGVTTLQQETINLKAYKFKQLCGKLFFKRLGRFCLYLPCAISEMLYYAIIFTQSITIDKLSNDEVHITMHKMELFIYLFGRMFYDGVARTLEFSYYPLLEYAEVQIELTKHKTQSLIKLSFSYLIFGAMLCIGWFALIQFVDLFYIFCINTYQYTGETSYLSTIRLYSLVNGVLNLAYELGVEYVYCCNCYVSPIIMLVSRIYEFITIKGISEHQYIENIFYAELDLEIQGFLAYLILMIYMMITHKPKKRQKKMKEATLIEIDKALGIKHHTHH